MTIKKEQWQEVMLSVLGRTGLLLLVLFTLLILSAFPFHLGSLGTVRPVFILIAVYYWSITRPDILSPIGVFATGIVFDLVCGYPPGMTALILLVVQWAIRVQRKFLAGQAFRVIWAGMAVVAFSACLVQWLLFCIFSAAFYPLMPVIFSATVTTLVFPVFVPALAKLNKVLAGGPSAG
jgi:rod shape-determining protein MreD